MSRSLPSALIRAAATRAQGPGKQVVIRRPPVVTIMGHVDHGKTTLLDQLRKSQIVKGEFGGITQHIGAFVVSFDTKAMAKKTALKDVSSRFATQISQNNKGAMSTRADDNQATLDHHTNNIDNLVTFLDTPGHAAFAAMRQRGADVTDIVVLVIASEDGCLDQTRESVKYAQKSNKPLIVVINKIDKFQNDRDLQEAVEKVCLELQEFNVVTELEGGDTQIVKISALKNIGIEHLKENILALAETLDLKAYADCPAEGTVIESSLDQHRGKLCTVLVQEGILRKGDIVLAGETNYAKVRTMFDEWGQVVDVVTPGFPVQIIGWRENDLPDAGEKVVQLSSEREARSVIHEARQRRRMQKALSDAESAARREAEHREWYSKKLQEKLKLKKEDVFKARVHYLDRGTRPKESKENVDAHRTINIILKCDVVGSLEAILDMLESYDKYEKQHIIMNIVHYGVGTVNENDFIMAASFPNSIIYGFNVKYANQNLASRSKNEGVSVRFFNVIYHLYDDLKATIIDKTPLVERVDELGSATVLQDFVITDNNKKKVHVAGSRCAYGKLIKGGRYILTRNNQVIAERMEVKTLKHFKIDVDTIEKDNECGISFKDHEDLEFKPGDQLTCLEVKLVKPKLKWDLKGFS